MATLADLRERTLHLLYGAPTEERPPVDTLESNITSGSTSLDVNNPDLWKVGDYVEFPDGELAVIVSQTGPTETVLRAQWGTTAASHSIGDVIRKNPPYPISAVDQAIEDVITNDLWPKVWMWSRGTVTWSAGDHVYDLPADVLEVDVVYQLPADEKIWKPFPTGWWDVEQQIHTDVATNSSMLRIANVFYSDQPIYYIGRQRPTFAGIADISDEVATTIPWGAARNMVAGRGAGLRLDPSQNVRTDDGAITRDYRVLALEFDRRVDQLHRKLYQEVTPSPRWRPRMRRSW